MQELSLEKIFLLTALLFTRLESNILRIIFSDHALVQDHVLGPDKWLCTCSWCFLGPGHALGQDLNFGRVNVLGQDHAFGPDCALGSSLLLINYWFINIFWPLLLFIYNREILFMSFKSIFDRESFIYLWSLDIDLSLIVSS